MAREDGGMQQERGVGMPEMPLLGVGRSCGGGAANTAGKASVTTGKVFV